MYYCKKASELKSLEELGLSEKTLNCLSMSPLSLEEMVYEARDYHTFWGFNNGMLGDRADSFFHYDSSQKPFLEDDRDFWGSQVYDCLKEFFTAIKEAGYLNENLSDMSSTKLFNDANIWDDVWESSGLGWDTLMDYFENYYEDEIYCRAVGYNPNTKMAILDILKEELTPSQYGIMKIYLKNEQIENYVTYSYYRDKERNLYEAGITNNFFIISDEDAVLLRSAIINCYNFLLRRIMEVILF